MIGWLVAAAATTSIVLVAVAAYLALRGRDLQLAPLVLAGVVQLLLVVLAVVIVVRLLLGERPQSSLLGGSYLSDLPAG